MDVWERIHVTAIMVTHDVNEAISRCDDDQWNAHQDSERVNPC